MAAMKKWSTRAVVVVGVLIICGLLLLRHPIQRWAYAESIINNDGPTEAQMNELIDRASDQSPSGASDLLLRLWRTGRMPQRHFVLTQLERPMMAGAPWEQFHSFALDGAASRDTSLVEPSLRLLLKHDRAEALSAATPLLSDADPDMRTTALRTISQFHDPRTFDLLLAALHDSDPLVQSQACLTLSTVTQIAPALKLADRQSVDAAATQWRAWQKSHPVAATAAPAPFTQSTTPIAAPDFAATDLTGKSVHLADLQGKTVVVNFWGTLCGPCVAELPDLVKFQAAHKDDVVVVGVCTDLIREDDGDGGDSEKDAMPRISSTIGRFSMTYPNVLDRDGKIVRLYNGSGVPLTVFIDGQGIVRRRYLGPRTADELEKMLATMPK